MVDISARVDLKLLRSRNFGKFLVSINLFHTAAKELLATCKVIMVKFLNMVFSNKIRSRHNTISVNFSMKNIEKNEIWCYFHSFGAEQSRIEADFIKVIGLVGTKMQSEKFAPKDVQSNQ